MIASGASGHVVARLVPLEPGLYLFALAGGSAARAAAPGLVLPAVQVLAAPDNEGRVEVADAAGRAASWLGADRAALFVTARDSGGIALVTGFLPRDPNSSPLALDIRRIADDRGARMTLALGGPVEDRTGRVAVDIIAHVRGRGDLRFLDPPWAGRLGPGQWIEAITVLPHSRAAAAAIEYKGLSASGAETPWLESGALCGTRGQGTPLLGFAVRQKAGSGGALFDCEYSGYFQSGALAGPARNGAPCRSALDNDPLEGLQLKITPRPPRRA